MKRFLPDTFTLLLVGAVLLASLLPISGEPAAWFGIATNIAIALLFFLHGARLSTDTVVAGFLHWRLQLFLPFVAGQILQPFIGNWIRSKKTLLNPFDRGSILMVVYLAFSEAVTEGIWHRLAIGDLALLILVDSLLLAAVLVITSFGGKLLGFNREDRITAVFCGSKKSLASGVPMASVIFAGQSIGAIVLPLMLFHQIQLMVCAWLARVYAQRWKAARSGSAAIS